MDILGGAGICRGPRNLLANVYTAMPIAITVEGANILTRTLMIFGQGAIRCHPYVYPEIAALSQHDLPAFDRAFWQHMGAFVRNLFRTGLLSLTRGRLARSPVSGATARYYRRLSWASATFACLTDIALFGFGGTLKRREKLTGRFADLLCWLYLGTATLRRFEAEGRPSEDLPLVDWAMQYSFSQMQQAFEGIFSNLLPPLLRAPVLAWVRLNPIGMPPVDRLGSQVAQSLLKPGQGRDRLTAGIYLPTDEQQALGRLEQAFASVHQAEPIFKRIKTAIRTGQLAPAHSDQAGQAACEAGLIDQTEWAIVREAERIRNDAIQVDAFTFEDYQRGNGLVDVKTTTMPVDRILS
jgi:acyl-CoA dehydrogenase